MRQLKQDMSLQLINQFKDFYRELQCADLGALAAIYSDDVLFQDPVHKVRGLVALEDYMASLCANLTECRFEYLDELVAQGNAYIKWDMHFRHARLGKRLITVRGATHIQFNERIDFHEDIYDMGAMLYEHLPLLGYATRYLKRQLGE